MCFTLATVLPYFPDSMFEDRDLAPVRNEKWFKELLGKL